MRTDLFKVFTSQTIFQAITLRSLCAFITQNRFLIPTPRETVASVTGTYQQNPLPKELLRLRLFVVLKLYRQKLMKCNGGKSAMTQVINQEVTINALYFAGQTMKTFPREIEYGGRAVTFMNGLRYLVQRGQEAIQLFDMSTEDGHTYRISRSGDRWMLLGRKGAF
ncbi:hypothetical protein IPL85_03825 [Candidatus Saccharibacteria bacterium]|nr:MAG: hypothetical protein IPL85_03825 [Candidatus Saccharibacteria bacterium]